MSSVASPSYYSSTAPIGQFNRFLTGAAPLAAAGWALKGSSQNTQLKAGVVGLSVLAVLGQLDKSHFQKESTARRDVGFALLGVAGAGCMQSFHPTLQKMGAAALGVGVCNTAWRLARRSKEIVDKA